MLRFCVLVHCMWGTLIVIATANPLSFWLYLAPFGLRTIGFRARFKVQDFVCQDWAPGELFQNVLICANTALWDFQCKLSNGGDISNVPWASRASLAVWVLARRKQDGSRLMKLRPSGLQVAATAAFFCKHLTSHAHVHAGNAEAVHRGCWGHEATPGLGDHTRWKQLSCGNRSEVILKACGYR